MLVNSLSSSQDGGNEVAVALVVGALTRGNPTCDSRMSEAASVEAEAAATRGSSGPCGRCMNEGGPDM